MITEQGATDMTEILEDAELVEEIHDWWMRHSLGEVSADSMNLRAEFDLTVAEANQLVRAWMAEMDECLRQNPIREG